MTSLSEDKPSEENYYATLNISKSATIEDINIAYRQWSLIYHPDKHTDTKKKKWAENMFNRIKTAHEVLSDPQKRSIYDALGKVELDSGEWKIIPRSQTNFKIMEEYKRLVEERRKHRLLLNNNFRGSTVVGINATDLFYPYKNKYKYNEYDDSIPSLEVSRINVSYSIESPIVSNYIVGLSSNVSTENGTGHGSFNLALKKITDNGWLEYNVDFSNNPATNFKIFRALTKNIFLTAVAGVQFSNSILQFNIVSSIATRLSQHTFGYLTYRTGLNPSMATTISRESHRSVANVTFQLSAPYSFTSISYTRKMFDGEMKLKGILRISTIGFEIEGGAEKQITPKVALSSMVSLNVPEGVSLKIKLIWGPHSFAFPIHLCEDPLISPWFYGVSFSIISWLVIKKIIIDPIKESQFKKEVESAKEKNITGLLNKQKEAKQIIDLMSELYARIVSEESKKDGLIIINAIYGRLPTGVNEHDIKTEYSENFEEYSIFHEVLNVTIPVQCLVKNSSLNLHPYSKSQLPGFYDVCIGKEKHLTIEYSYDGKIYVETFKDEELIKLPHDLDYVLV